MKFLSDWVALSMAIGLLCGGCVIGRRVGAFAAVWLAGAALLALRMADILWEPAAQELARMGGKVEAVDALAAAYGLIFVCTMLPAVILLLVLRPTGNVELPARLEPGVSALAGMVAGLLMMAAVLQSQIQEPAAHEAMPHTMAWAKSALKSIGQTHTASRLPPEEGSSEEAP